MSVIEEVESRPPRGRRWWWLAAIAAVLGTMVAAYIHTHGLPHSTTEPSPAAEGYHSAGSIQKVAFWIDVSGDNDVGIRTTGRLGGICNSRGPYKAVLGPVPVCAQSIPEQGSVFAFVLPAATTPKPLSLTNGQTIDPTGSLPVDQLPGDKLVVYLVPPTSHVVGIADTPS